MARGRRKRITERDINTVTGEIERERQIEIEQVRAERFIIMMIGDQWDLVLSKLQGNSALMLIFIIVKGFVKFGDGTIRLASFDKQALRDSGLNLTDSAIWRAIKILKDAGVLISKGRAIYVLNKKYFNNGKATTWVADKGKKSGG